MILTMKSLLLIIEDRCCWLAIVWSFLKSISDELSQVNLGHPIMWFSTCDDLSCLRTSNALTFRMDMFFEHFHIATLCGRRFQHASASWIEKSVPAMRLLTNRLKVIHVRVLAIGGLWAHHSRPLERSCFLVRYGDALVFLNAVSIAICDMFLEDWHWISSIWCNRLAKVARSGDRWAR